MQVSVPSSKPWKEICKCFSVQYCSGRPFKPSRFTLYQWTMSTFPLFHRKKYKKTQSSTKPIARAWEEFYSGKLMTFPEWETFTSDLNTTPCQLHFPANSSPVWEKDWASDRWWWQTTAAYGGSVQESHSSSKGHNSQLVIPRANVVRQFVICDQKSTVPESEHWETWKLWGTVG